MNKEVKEKWLEALRSGEYKQTAGHLRDGFGYCCLGVLCDIYHKETGKGEWKNTENFDEEYIFAENKYISCGVPILPIITWSGIPEKNPIVFKGTSLAELNDDGKTFEEIAQIIEEKL